MKYMTRVILAISAALAFATSVYAQSAHPKTVSYAYRFHRGQQLRYRLIDKVRDPTVQGCNGYTNYDRIEDASIEVESVDANGNATLKVTNDERFDWRSGVDGTTLTQGGRDIDVPVYRATIDPFGNLLSGDIIRRSPKDSAFHEKMKQPGFVGFTQPDTSQIKSALSSFLPIRVPGKAERTIGEHWIDSSRHDMSPDIIGLDSSSTPPPDAQEPTAYEAIHRKESIQTGLATSYSMKIIEDKDEVFGDQSTRFHTERTELRRASDGIPISQSIGYSSTQNGVNVMGFTHTDIMLVGGN